MKHSLYRSLIAVIAVASLLLGGCGQTEPVLTDPSEPSSLTTAETGFSGWWVLSPNYYEGVIPLVSIFYIDESDAAWTLYDRMGNPGGTFSCSFPDAETILLDMDALGSQELYLENGILFYTDDDHEAYVKTDDPGFLEVPDLTGTWTLRGDSTLGEAYELTETEACKISGGIPGEPCPYQVSLSTVSTGSETLRDQILYLAQEWPNPALYPSRDGLVLIEKDSFRNNIYIRDGAHVSPGYADTLDFLTNTSYVRYDDPSGERYRSLVLQGDFTFAVISFVFDGEWYTQDTEAAAVIGMWELNQDLELSFRYNDGTEDTLDLSDWDGILNLDLLGLEFMPDGPSA